MGWNAITLADWSGSIAAGISIICLFRKSLWYWYVSIIATGLWLYVFVETDSLMVAGLQIFYIAFALYGIARWAALERGRVIPDWLDHAGLVLALAILASAAALTDFDGWPSSLEFAAVALAVIANWLTALRIVWCWPIWILSNVAFAILFFHLGLWGVFTMQFVYAALSVVGWRAWLREDAVGAEPVLMPTHA